MYTPSNVSVPVAFFPLTEGVGYNLYSWPDETYTGVANSTVTYVCLLSAPRSQPEKSVGDERFPGFAGG